MGTPVSVGHSKAAEDGTLPGSAERAEQGSMTDWAPEGRAVRESASQGRPGHLPLSSSQALRPSPLKAPSPCDERAKEEGEGAGGEDLLK